MKPLYLAYILELDIKVHDSRSTDRDSLHPEKKNAIEELKRYYSLKTNLACETYLRMLYTVLSFPHGNWLFDPSDFLLFLHLRTLGFFVSWSPFLPGSISL